MDIGIPFLPHAYPVEIIQFIAASVGTAASLWGTRDAWRDLRFLYLTGMNGHRLFIAKKNYFEEWMRLILHVLFLTSGLFSVLAPPPSIAAPLPTENFHQLWISRTVMAVASIILMIKSVRDNKDRKHLRSMLDRPPSDLLDTIKDKASDIVSAIDQTRTTEGAD